jgi:hypothetical protein
MIALSRVFEQLMGAGASLFIPAPVIFFLYADCRIRTKSGILPVSFQKPGVSGFIVSFFSFHKNSHFVTGKYLIQSSVTL